MYAAIIIITGITLFWYLFTRHLNYWKREGVPQSSVVEILIDTYTLLTKKQSLAHVFENYCLRFRNNRYFGIYQLFRKSLIVHDAELIKQITVKDFEYFVDHGLIYKGDEPFWDRSVFALQGEEWRNMRTILTPAFTSSKLKLMYDLLLKCTEQFIKHFEKQVGDKQCITVELKEAYVRFASDVIASIAFGYSCDSFENPDNDFYLNSQKILPTQTVLGNIKIFILLNIPRVAQLFGLRFYSKAGSDFFFNIMRKNVKNRIEQKIVRPDIINLLLEAKNNVNKTGMDLNNVDVTAQAMFFFFAGVDTVSGILGFMSYELAISMDIQKRLQKEVDETLREGNGSVTFEALNKMKYMDMVVSETLRKWPTTIASDRKCAKPYVIQPVNPGEKPIHLKKGDVIWLPMYCIQRNPKEFPDPEKFDPERFSEENKSSFHPYSYIPFGAGPRICIGNRLATIEIKLLFVQLLSRFDIVPVDKTLIPPELSDSSILLSMQGGFWLGLRRRCKEL